MLGEIYSWEDFLEADKLDLESLPRKMLKSGAKDVKQNVLKNVKLFCAKNFENMTEAKLDLLYEEIKATRGIEFPLKVFEHRYSKIHKRVLKNAPPHVLLSFLFGDCSSNSLKII